jgi:hypothetical protein
MSEETIHKGIELRSEKVRNIVGQVPPFLLRKGILIISFAIFLLLGIAWFLPYPETIPVDVNLYSEPQTRMICAPEDGVFQYDHHSEIGYLRTFRDSIIKIQSPYSGSVILNCKNNSPVNKGDILYTVIPDSIHDLSAIGYVTGNEAGKVPRNQKVEMEISGSFFQEPITVNGSVLKIYPIPNSDRYKIDIEITDSHRSQLVKKLKSPILLQGKGKITVSDQSILKRFLNKHTQQHKVNFQ